MKCLYQESHGRKHKTTQPSFTKSTLHCFFFVVGASGAGKTTSVKVMESELKGLPISFNYFDDIGIPSSQEMITTCGSGEKWQQATTEL